VRALAAFRPVKEGHVMRKASLFVVALGLSLSNCSNPEGQVLTKFFMATKSKDNATLTGLTLVGFPEEIVTSWKVTHVGPERREPYKFPELVKNVTEIKRARDRQVDEFTNWRQGNVEELTIIEEKLKKDPAATFKGSTGQVHAAWEKYRAERRALEARLNEAERLLDGEQKLTGMSLLGPSDPKSLSGYAGEVLTKEVGVNVKVKDGVDKPYLFTLQRYALTHLETNRAAQARWIITEIKPGEAASAGGAS